MLFIFSFLYLYCSIDIKHYRGIFTIMDGLDSVPNKISSLQQYKQKLLLFPAAEIPFFFFFLYLVYHFNLWSKYLLLHLHMYFQRNFISDCSVCLIGIINYIVFVWKSTVHYCNGPIGTP